MVRKYSLIFLIFFSVFTNAQTPLPGMTIENEFKVTTVPDKWKNESAIIIGQKSEYLFSRVSLNKNSSNSSDQ